MKIEFDPRVEKFLEKLNYSKKSKAFEYISLFEEYVFNLSTEHLKKVTKYIWELRPAKMRLFLLKKGK